MDRPFLWHISEKASFYLSLSALKSCTQSKYKSSYSIPMKVIFCLHAQSVAGNGMSTSAISFLRNRKLDTLALW